MKQLDAASILGDRSSPLFLVCGLDLHRASVQEWFGFAPHVAWEDGPGEADYWAVEFPCGLQMVAEYFHTSNSGVIVAIEPSPQHVTRHLKHWKDHLREISGELHDKETAYLIGRYAAHPNVRDLKAFQLWRNGEDGNAFPVGEPTSRRDAECWQAELESHKHKQTYWVSRAAT